MNADEPVLLHVSIDFKRSESSIETGYTVAEWNALTPAERTEIACGIWEAEMANADQGGMSVETDGAEAI